MVYNEYQVYCSQLEEIFEKTEPVREKLHEKEEMWYFNFSLPSLFNDPSKQVEESLSVVNDLSSRFQLSQQELTDLQVLFLLNHH